ncbi:MAG: ABC transporter ATP-binding protein [Burkholderiales bacterium]|nr:ABC transporter ATP-binding protein [Burkholderiales bacterium]
MIHLDDLWVDYPLADSVHTAVAGVSLEVVHGEFFTLLGPSGCGKTSALRSVAGLERPSRGSIRIGSTLVFDEARGVDVPTHRRDVSMVFQSYAVWPHLTVAQNVAFPLEVAGIAREERAGRVADALRLVGLESISDRPATQLSGGQQQRVAIARGIVRRSGALLLDEPLSNLDAKLRQQMRFELRDLMKRVGMTAIYVTHDQDEAMTLSDRVAVMNEGRIVELGSPQELYLRPRTRFVATFLGRAVVFEAVGSRTIGSDGVLMTDVGPICVGSPPAAGRIDALMIRPEAISLSREPAPVINGRQGRIVKATFAGAQVDYLVAIEDGPTIAVVGAPFDAYRVGDRISVAFPPERLSCIAN